MSRDTTFKIGALAFGFAALVSTLAFFAFVLRGPMPDPKPITSPTPVVGEGADSAFSCGWKPDPEAVEEFRATLDVPDFKDTPAGKAVMGEMPSRVYIWQIIRKITGKDPPIFNQNPVGSCVGFGTSRAFESTLAMQISLGDRFEWKPVVEEAIYAGSRVEVGRGRLRGSDGSNGSWAAAWLLARNKMGGGIPRGVYTIDGKTYDLSKYNPTMCRQWGDNGVPEAIRKEAQKYPAGDVTMVTTWGEARKALAQGYGIAICSTVGFNKPGSPYYSVNPANRDARGVCVGNAYWPHCMCLDGYHVDEGTGKEYGHIQNSWGERAHGGPVGWGEPPVSGFWVDAKTIGEMLAQRDSWAISAVKGFPARKIDWFALLPKKDRDDRFTLSISRRFNP